MSRGGIKITRCADDFEAQQASEVPSWMKEFASKAEGFVQAEEHRQKEAVTVVDNARERQDSVYQQMYAIMNGKKPLYSSVEEAVVDYQKKTGLNDYIEKVQAESSMKSAAAQILSSAAAYDEDESLAEKKTPENGAVLIFKDFPATKDYVTNVVTSNPKLPPPAVIHMIAENFESDGVDSNHLDDPNLLKHISDLIIENAKPDTADYSMMGRNIGLENEKGDDTFLGILRDKGGF